MMDPLPIALANPPLIYAIRFSGLTIKVFHKYLIFLIYLIDFRCVNETPSISIPKDDN